MSPYLEPGLLAELERRVGEAEAKFLEADLELKLDQLEQAKQRQVYRLITHHIYSVIYRVLANNWLDTRSSPIIG